MSKDRFSSLPNQPVPEPNRLSRGVAIALLSSVALGAYVAKQQGDPLEDMRTMTTIAPTESRTPTLTLTPTLTPSPETTTPVYTLEMPQAVPTSFDVGALVKKSYGSEKVIEKDRTKRDIVTYSFKDGKLVISELAPNLQPTDPTIAPLTAAVLDNESGLTAAMRAGTLDAVSFDFDTGQNSYPSDGFPEYIVADSSEGGSDQDVIRYSFPTHGKIDSENIATMLRHENLHAIVQRLGFVDRFDTEIPSGEIVPVDMERYSSICTSLRDIAVREALPFAEQSAAALEQLTQLLDAKYQPVFTEVVESLRNGTFGQYQATQGKAEGSWESVLQSCSVDDPWKVAVRLLKSRGMSTPDFGNDMKLWEVESKVRHEWDVAIRDHSLYKVIRENTYFKKGTQKHAGMGHPYDSANELIASLINVATRFPDEFRDSLQTLPEDQQALLRELLVLAAGDIKRLHQKLSPQFVIDLDAGVAKVTR